MKLYGIVGAGGFGREVMPLAETMLKTRLPKEDYELVFVDQHPSLALKNGIKVISFDDFFTHQADEKFFNITIASYAARENIAAMMQEKNIAPFAIEAANHVNLGHNEIGLGAIFCAFTTVTANAKIGKFFHANIYSYVAHDCVIGDYVTFAPNVHCNGNIIIEDYAYIGTGAIIKQGTSEKPLIIGKGAIVGMGAVVTKSVPPYETVVGNPARALVRQPSTQCA